MSESNLAIVVGNNYSSMLGVIQSLGEKGIPVDVLMLSKNKMEQMLIRKSKYVHALFSVAEKDETKIVDFLLQRYSKLPKKPVIFTTGDYFASVLDNHLGLLSACFLVPHANIENRSRQGQITYLMDKSVQNRMARLCGLDTSKEQTINLRYEISLTDEIPYPCIVKPQVSCIGFKGEIKKCSDRTELLKHLEALKKHNSNRSVLVQEFLSVKEEYILTGVCFDQTVIAPILSRRLKVAEYKKGLTIAGEILDVSIISPVIEQFKKLLQDFHYVGYFGMDVFLCTDGRIVFNEMNFRATGVMRGLTKAGFNAPYMLYQYLVSGKTDFDYQVQYGSVFFHDRVAWDEYIHDTISKEELNHYMKISNFHTIQDEKDNGPYLYCRIQYYQDLLKKMIKRFIHR